MGKEEASKGLALTDPEAFPDEAGLEQALGASKRLLDLLRGKIEEMGITVAWQYYRDGKAWLGKFMKGKSNLGWLHIKKGGFGATVYFTAETLPDAQGAVIGAGAGKLIPLTVEARSEVDLETIVRLLGEKAAARKKKAAPSGR